MPIRSSPARGTLVLLLTALALGACRQESNPPNPPTPTGASNPEPEPVKPPGQAPANTIPRTELALEPAVPPVDAPDGEIADVKSAAPPTADAGTGEPPILFGDLAAIGTTPVGDLSDVVWDGEHPCVIQGGKGDIVRCWEPRGRQWGAPVQRPAQAEPGILITEAGTTYKGRQVRLITRSAGETRTCSLQEGDRRWQTFTARDTEAGSAFCPERVSLSPWDRLGSAVALVRGGTADGSPRYRLWWFSTTTPE